MYGTPALQKFWCTVVLHGHRTLVQKPERPIRRVVMGLLPNHLVMMPTRPNTLVSKALHTLFIVNRLMQSSILIDRSIQMNAYLSCKLVPRSSIIKRIIYIYIYIFFHLHPHFNNTLEQWIHLFWSQRATQRASGTPF